MLFALIRVLLLFSLQSKLEFFLRLQEFVELVKAKNFMHAIAYARKYLSPWGATHMKELQRVTATLVFRSSTNCAPYKVSSIVCVLLFFFFGVTACLHHESDHIFSFKYIIIYLTICAFLESPLISTPIGVELHHSLHTMCLCSQVLFEQNQWDSLVDQFKQEFCKLYGMTLEPLLNIYMQAGLTALKTPYPSPDHYFPLHLYHLI